MSPFRTFRAPDTRSALAMVKAALGPEAVIVSTREVENGLFRPKEIEVTAATADAPALNAPASANAYVPAKTAPRPSQPDPAVMAEWYRSPPAVRPTPPPPLAPPAAAIATAPARAENTEEIQQLRASMEEMRRELRKMSQQVRMERELSLPPAGTELLAQLIHRGVEEALAQECVRQAIERAPNHNPATLDAAIREVLAERVASAPAPWVAEPHRRIIAMVGPTGVGKTTSVAKIAARALLETRQKVALITVDTYRIGASEQLTRYGEIMNVPTFVARDRIELTRSIEKCRDADLVLIDTAGRSVSEAVARQAEMLRSIEGVSLTLTLSAAIGAREMAAAAERYRLLAPDRLLVTKVDEAIGPGSLLSASARIGRPVTAVSDGQRVPEDIHALSSAELIELVLGTRTRTAVGGR